MFGFGLKAKTEKIIEEDLGYFVSMMFSNRFSHIVSQGKSLGQNEYSIAIEFVLYCVEHLESVWSEKAGGKVANEEIIDSIKEKCKNIEAIVHLSNTSESDTRDRIERLLSKL